MKRAQRNLFIIMAAMVAFYSIVTRLPWQAAAAVLAAALLAFIVIVIWGRDYFVGRRLLRRRRWSEAVAPFQRFEQKLLKAYWPHAAIVLYLSVYTFDGVAVARNNIAQALLNAGDLDKAAAWLRSSLQRDPQYALPYVNLGVIAAMRGDEQNARREMYRAVQLGYSPAAAQRALRQALASADQK